ncbi:MAG: MltA domain-containing protein [Planctomycetes bacterium]|nr:MltA domain-containing protein [Planctomycetota bacterium]
MRRVPRRLGLLAATLVLASCTTRYPVKVEEPPKDYARPLPEGMMALEKITDPALYPDFAPGFEDRESLVRAIDYSLGYFKAKSSLKYYPYLDISHERCVKSLRAFRALLGSVQSGTELHERICAEFDVYRSIGWDGSGAVLFTGYCEPIYKGSLARTETFRYPLYRRPKDLMTDADGTPRGRRMPGGGTVPYATRAEIEEGGLFAGQGLELVWLADPLEVYIVHVQGSARVDLPDGRQIKIGYAGKTDRPYKSVGLALVQDGKFAKSELSLTRIKQYFHEHPEDLPRYLNQNESYVFFTENQGGPFGSLGVPVTRQRTIATDKQVYPRGNVAFLQTTVPVLDAGRNLLPMAFNRFVLDQDTGGAIRSAGRCDIFLGTGPDAELLAGHTTYEGRMYYVFLKDPHAAAAAPDGALPQATYAPAPGAGAVPASGGAASGERAAWMATAGETPVSASPVTGGNLTELRRQRGRD